MKMFIANCTKQNRDFHYRVPEGGVRRQSIEIGKQIQLSGDLSQPAIDSIIEQHRVYGMLSVEEARKAKGGVFVGLCFSIDKPVSIENMSIVLQHNDEVLTELGQQQRLEAAVATTAAIKQNGDMGLKALETSITEFRKDGGEPEVQEGVRVDESAAGGRPVKETGRNAKAKLAK